ncbi:hypothetical protein Trydic_g5145 [Trypoxylus dichotomus]
MFKANLTLFLLLIIAFSSFTTTFLIKQKKIPKSHTSITASNSTRKSYIEFGIINKQHHLYIGRCRPSDVKFHGENIILNNDGDNHVTAIISINVESNVYITCVNILDQIPDGKGGYPKYLSGGVGYNFIEFEVMTNYGKGFNFYVEVFGYYL